MATGRARSAVTGRYITMSAAVRNPRTTVVEKPSNGNSSTAYRSAITGRRCGAMNEYLPFSEAPRANVGGFKTHLRALATEYGLTFLDRLADLLDGMNDDNDVVAVRGSEGPLYLAEVPPIRDAETSGEKA